MAQITIKWHKIADSKEAINWQPNQLAVAEAAGKKFTIAQTNGRLTACAYYCPHASGVLADGLIDAKGNIVCPRHAYRFNLVNGRNTSGEGYHLKTYAVEEREAGVFIALSEVDGLKFQE